MSELTAARDWAQRARELVDKGRRDAADQDALALQAGLRAFAADPAVREKLAPELAQALDDLAGALVSEPPRDGEPAAEPPSPELRRMYEEFRTEFDRQRKSLVLVLTPAEAGTLELALELGDDQAALGRFEPALTLLQKASHRARAIRDEGRAGGLVDTGSADAAQSRAEREKREQALQAAMKTAGDRVTALMRQLDPMSRDENTLCSRFGFALQQQVLQLTRGGDPLAVLEAWAETLAEIAKDEAGNARRERKRLVQESEQAARDRLAKAGPAAHADRIAQQVEQHLAPLADAARRITEWKLGAPQKLESDVAALQFEVTRQLNGLKQQDVSTEAGRTAAARLLVKAEAALDVLRLKAAEAPDLVRQAKASFDAAVGERQRKLDDYLGPKDEAVRKQGEDVARKRATLEQARQMALQLKDSGGKRILNPSDPTTLKWYEDQVTLLGTKKKPTAAEVTQLKIARDVVAAHERNTSSAKAVVDAEAALDVLVKARDSGLAPLFEAVEAVKRPLEILWAHPADIDYGTPLDATQLNATLSAPSGTLQYLADDKPIVPGRTRLPAGAGRTLRAVVVGSDAAVFRTPVPRDVTIQVNPAAVALACASDVTVDYGVPFQAALLAPAVVTTPRSENDHAGLLKALVCVADGKTIEPGTILGAKVHAVTVRIPAGGNFKASADVAVSLTVKPARRTVAWDGAAPLTMTFPAKLTDKQLNASVVVTADPPLSAELAKPGRVLAYVDEAGQVVKIGDVLDAGAARRITARTPAVDNFDVGEKTIEFKVDKAVRTLAAAAPGPIGALVQSNDLRQLRSKVTFTAGAGEAQFFVGNVELAVGARLAAGKNVALRVAARPDDNYQPTPERLVQVDVLALADKRADVQQGRADVLAKTVHSQQAQAMTALNAKVLAAATEDEKFARLDELANEVAEIDAKLARWKGAVPGAVPEGDRNLLKVVIQEDDNPTEAVQQARKVAKTVEAAKQLIKHGGLTVEDVEKLVPKNTADSYVPSGNYPDGFKYRWTTPSGVTIEVYGHGKTTAANVPAASDSKKGNLVRVMIDGQYLKPDGTLTAVATDADSHMALY